MVAALAQGVEQGVEHTALLPTFPTLGGPEGGAEAVLFTACNQGPS